MNAKPLPTALTSAFQSTLLLFFLFFPVSFMQMIAHESGHALADLSRGATIRMFYVHPFSFLGYVRATSFWNSVWTHASGTVVGILVPLFIFILLWKRRSFYTLPLLLVFPWTAIFHAIGVLDIPTATGDYYNLIRITGLPAIVFYGMGFILLVVGIFFFISLFPLLGLAPEDRKSLFVVPAGMFLHSVLGIVVAHLFVPGSPIDVRYQLAGEIISSANNRLFIAIAGVVIAVIYGTLYRRGYLRLPAGFRTEKVGLSWRDLWYPGLLFTISVILGLIVIH
jgi:hypothetical protein